MINGNVERGKGKQEKERKRKQNNDGENFKVNNSFICVYFLAPSCITPYHGQVT